MADGETAQTATLETVLEERRARREAQQQQTEAVESVDDAPAEEESETVTQTDEVADGEAAEPNPEGEEQEPAEPPKAAIPPPDFWDESGKEAFAKLSPEAQQAVTQYEKQRTAAVARKMNEAAQIQKAAQAKQQQLTQIMESVSGFVSEVDRALLDYQNIDWQVEIAEATTPEAREELVWHQARYNALVLAKQQAEEARTQAEIQEHQDFIQREAQFLGKINPSLNVKTKEGAERVDQVYKFLKSTGLDDNTLNWMPAIALDLAHDAMRWRMQQAKAKSAAKPPPQKPPAGPTAAPVSSQQGSPRNQRLSQLESKKTLSTEEFVEMQRLRRKSKR